MCSTPHYSAKTIRPQSINHSSGMPIDLDHWDRLIAQRDAQLEQRAKRQQSHNSHAKNKEHTIEISSAQVVEQPTIRSRLIFVIRLLDNAIKNRLSTN